MKGRSVRRGRGICVHEMKGRSVRKAEGYMCSWDEGEVCEEGGGVYVFMG